MTNHFKKKKLERRGHVFIQNPSAKMTKHATIAVLLLAATAASAFTPRHTRHTPLVRSRMAMTAESQEEAPVETAAVPAPAAVSGVSI